jgi:hypothetical protein
MPVAGLDETVAPVIAQVNLVTEQLSAVVGFAVATLALHPAIAPAVVKAEMFDGQVIVGLILSVTVTVNEQVAELP